MADMKISELSSVASLNNGDLIEVSQVDSGSPTGYSSMKASMIDVGNKVNNNIQYTQDLDTTSKTIVGAVNEVNGRTKPTTVTPTFNSSQSNYSIPFNNTKVYKIGNIVYFTSTIQPDTPYSSSPGQEVYSGLPKPYSNDSIYMGFCAWNVTSNNMRAIVTSDGKLLCRGGNTGTAYDVSFSYVCQ